MPILAPRPEPPVPPRVDSDRLVALERFAEHVRAVYREPGHITRREIRDALRILEDM